MKVAVVLMKNVYDDKKTFTLNDDLLSKIALLLRNRKCTSRWSNFLPVQRNRDRFVGEIRDEREDSVVPDVVTHRLSPVVRNFGLRVDHEGNPPITTTTHPNTDPPPIIILFHLVLAYLLSRTVLYFTFVPLSATIMFKKSRRRSKQKGSDSLRSHRSTGSNTSSSVGTLRGILKRSPSFVRADQPSEGGESSAGSRSSNTRPSAVPPRKVSFSTIAFREFERVIGDNPSCSSGAPIG